MCSVTLGMESVEFNRSLPANEIQADHLTVNCQSTTDEIYPLSMDEIETDFLILNRQSVTAEIQAIRQ
jgi:hypothetical protein